MALLLVIALSACGNDKDNSNTEKKDSVQEKLSNIKTKKDDPSLSQEQIKKEAKEYSYEEISNEKLPKGTKVKINGQVDFYSFSHSHDGGIHKGDKFVISSDLTDDYIVINAVNKSYPKITQGYKVKVYGTFAGMGEKKYDHTKKKYPIIIAYAIETEKKR